MLALMTLLACTANTPDDDSASTVPTDSFPSFYGSAPKNLLVISLDTFRRDHMARYGDTRNLTPFLDSIANNGLALDDHQSCSNWTFPGVICAMDGRSPLEYDFVPSFAREPVPDRGTLASWLSGAGYHTIMITSNGWLYDDTNVAYGYDYANHPGGDGAIGIYEGGRDLLLEAIDDGADPWFLHIHLKEPHTPYSPPDSYLDDLDDLTPVPYNLDDFDEHYDAASAWNSLTDKGRALLLEHLTVRYTGELRYLDDLLQQIWIDLTARGLLKDTLVVFWTDHGEQFWEHDYQAHARGLNQEENAAIALMWADNIIPVAWEEPTTHADIAPTILSILGVDIPDEVSGKVAGTADPNRAIFSFTQANLGIVQSVRRGDDKMIYRWGTGEKWLYNVAEDPTEAINLYSAEDPIVEDLWDLLGPRVSLLDELVVNEPVDPGP
ncbi:MAG: arylsulfatase A-like enzyme [Myxococcota bacterium]|jgi:arylsulfatase A-like enzyme